MPEPIRLTQTVKKGGCAAKVAAATLRSLLRGVQFPPQPPEVLVDGSTFDDAAVYRLDDERSLVQTLDFFTPIVDSPRLFGRIAAANALSDVYAMGGRPATCLAILAWPLATFDDVIPREVIQGACDVIAEAGAALVGGHSIDDESLKFGLSVSGFVETRFLWTNSGCRPGDRLLLTKPLGTGTLTAGLKAGAYSEEEIRQATDSMCRLNNVVDQMPKEWQAGVHAATDITGFGLAGHAMQMAQSSDVCLAIEVPRIPRFERVEQSLSAGHRTKAHRTNREYTASGIQIEEVSELEELLLYDPQTSGGLLLSVAAELAEAMCDRLGTVFPGTSLIGEVRPRSAAAVHFSGGESGGRR